jgi:pseudouridine synthase
MKASPKTLKAGLERLERYMAHKGISSRREAKALITDGAVLVNGKVVTEPGFGINPDKDEVTLKQEKLPEKETVLFYKPRGIETSATSAGSLDIVTAFPKLAHLSPIGRLDKESEGLILLSNDGTLARALTAENSHVEKEYLVGVREEVRPDDMVVMSAGIMLDDTMTKPAIARQNGRNAFTIVLKEGRKHQIRRMCDACRLTVTSLVRVRIGHLTMGKMKSGAIKIVPLRDVERLKNL